MFDAVVCLQVTAHDKDLQIAVKDIIREDSKREKCKLNITFCGNSVEVINTCSIFTCLSAECYALISSVPIGDNVSTFLLLVCEILCYLIKIPCNFLITVVVVTCVLLLTHFSPIFCARRCGERLPPPAHLVCS